ncbi:PIN domain-containing protein [Janibacter sp. GXQ6167]|uniref:PIN domain-containing protein n=1 Tax=Janibacter sp. GXQ6167 TaxID=3240791 RepID=UPI0035255142
MSFPVFIDTCALYPAALADLLLRIAERGAYRLHWSADVLEELERNLAKIESVGRDGARRRVGAMIRAFPEAEVTGYELLIGAMACDPKDRHVLAAAVHSDCQVIVTFNVRDFPDASLEPHHLSVITPDDFLLDQLDLYPSAVLSALREQAGDLRRPRLTPLGLLASLERSGTPRFAAEVRRKANISQWSRGHDE